MRFLLIALLFVPAASAQPSAILEDLEQRAFAALNNVPRATTSAEAEKQRGPLRRRLEESLGLARVGQADPATALLYVPKGFEGPVPAIIVVRPHEDPRSAESHVFAASLARLGFVVVSLDVRVHHARLDLLPVGVTPQGLMQREVRAALALLLSRSEIDRQRIGLVGTGLTATIAAAINPQFSVVVLTDGAPDLKEQIGRLRARAGNDLPDTCDLIPGLLQYAGTQELLAMIAPRPILSINSAQNPFDYATELYRWFGASDKLSQEAGSDLGSRYAAYRWLARWLLSRTDLDAFSEPAISTPPVALQLPQPTEAVGLPRHPFSQAALTSLLGSPLPEGHMRVGLSVALQQRITLATQLGVNIPVTVFRPGPEGGAPGKGTLIAIDDRGREALVSDEIVQEAHRRGWTVWAVDPRGVGELKTDREAFVFTVSLLLGENFVWRQASDISRIIGFIGRDVHQPSALYARGKNMSLVAMYVAATADRNSPEVVFLRDGIFSFAADSNPPLYSLPFNALSTFDIPDLAAAAKPKILAITRLEEFLRADW